MMYLGCLDNFSTCKQDYLVVNGIIFLPSKIMC